MEEQRDQGEEDSVSLASPQHAHRNTNFFIDNILRPDFGCRRERGGNLCPGSSSSSSSSLGSSTGSSPVSGRVSEAERGSTESSSALSSPGEGESSSPGKDSLWPAWVYCTRYSDRPSSGKAW